MTIPDRETVNKATIELYAGSKFSLTEVFEFSPSLRMMSNKGVGTKVHATMMVFY